MCANQLIKLSHLLLDKSVQIYNRTYKYTPVPREEAPSHRATVKDNILYKFICAAVVS